jgi:D-sedoheptulose 7-phosphate isomerase
MKHLLEQIARDHASAVTGMLTDNADALIALAHICATALTNKRKLMFAGNGGSACDAMHITGEFVGRFVHDRRALAAIALTPDSGILTCIANDYSYEDVFSRQVEALGQPGDVLITMSTSGKSPNVLKALALAKEMNIATALFTGDKGRGGPAMADSILIAPSLITAHVQEAHMVALHGLVQLIEAELFPSA